MMFRNSYTYENIIALIFALGLCIWGIFYSSRDAGHICIDKHKLIKIDKMRSIYYMSIVLIIISLYKGDKMYLFAFVTIVFVSYIATNFYKYINLSVKVTPQNYEEVMKFIVAEVMPALGLVEKEFAYLREDKVYIDERGKTKAVVDIESRMLSDQPAVIVIRFKNLDKSVMLHTSKEILEVGGYTIKGIKGE